ncbi:hypothetical protein WA1_07650 [Scytonema hofmannii PCC 7110]|uniref:Uncharacterized protein n=1 Tax=Scytonema hofmannii PCC 7110 TaxID=128403 RepID=A0A139WTD5_9CYAN|nr:hypothetical protein WA1_07650 [Scytonema hofmannii PCC 7110]
MVQFWILDFGFWIGKALLGLHFTLGSVAFFFQLGIRVGVRNWGLGTGDKGGQGETRENNSCPIQNPKSKIQNPQHRELFTSQ